MNKKINRIPFIITLLAGTFTMSISQSSLSTAYPTLMKFFNIPANTIQWLTTAFMLVMCIVMPISPWLLNNISFKRIYLFVLGIFEIGTLIIIFSKSFPMALFGRILEAIAVGLLFPSFQTVLMSITPKDNRGFTMGLAGLVMGFALACGPIISGIVLNYMTWQFLFLIFLSIIFILFILSLFFIKDVMPREKYNFDLTSALSLTGIAFIMYSINQISSIKHLSLISIVSLIIGTILTIYFVNRQLKIENPLLNLHILKNKNFDLSILLTAFSYISLIVLTIIYPLYFQSVLNLTIINSGLALVFPAVILGLLNPLTGKLADKIGFKITLITGMSLIFTGWICLTLFYNRLNIPTMIFLGIMIEGGNAFTMMPATTLGANSLPKNLIPDGTAIITTIRQIMGALGVLFATLILVNINKSNYYPATSGLIGYKFVFLSLAIIEIFGLLFALIIKDTQISN